MEVINNLAVPIALMLGAFMVVDRVFWALVEVVRFVRGVTGQPE